MDDGPTRNQDIEAATVRLLGEDKEMLGVFDIEDAQAKADEAGMDLVMVSPDADPPVCRIMDYSRFKFEKEKKDREARRKANALKIEIKELKMRHNIDVHDYDVRMRAAQRFLGEGDKVKVRCANRATTRTGAKLNLLSFYLHAFRVVLVFVFHSTRAHHHVTGDLSIPGTRKRIHRFRPRHV